jgi:nicotinate-nucleotide pyrophosphorylase (carboxylating)
MDTLIDDLLTLALAEDVGEGDHTTLACVPPEVEGRARLLVKEAGILAGIEAAKRIFRHFDDTIEMDIRIVDGAEINPGDVAFVATGRIRSLLQVERLVLNVMQRMSGIATNTRRYVKCLEGTDARILDTRKTTPGMRTFEKEAVRIGGGTNHRFGLFDMILLKDNHVDFAGGIAPAIRRTQEYLRTNGKDLEIEIEVRNLIELEEVLRCGGVQRILLDNFSIEATREAVHLVRLDAERRGVDYPSYPHRYKLESSGGITFETIQDYARTGIDFISVGALTHSVESLDLSLKAISA